MNGKETEAPDGLSVAELLARLGLSERRVAVELNGAIIPVESFADRPVADGDTLEILGFVGGG